MKMENFSILTSRQSEFIDITNKVSDIVSASGIKDGVSTIFVPHTTAAVTINEGADSDVIKDILMWLDESVKWNHPQYKHTEGNSAAHIKSSLIGSSVHIIISRGKLQLGVWQAVFFCEFDGPRTRTIWVKGNTVKKDMKEK